MRKLYVLFIMTALVAGPALHAQIKKGAVFLGGDIGGSMQETKRDGNVVAEGKALEISPVFGIAIRENLIAGIDIGAGWMENTQNPGGNPNYKSSLYKAGIFIRKYKAIGKSNFALFLQGRAGIDYSVIEYGTQPAPIEEIKRYVIGIGLYPGISYTVSKRLQLETGFNNILNINYTSDKTEYGGTTAYTTTTRVIGISSSLDNLSSLYLGFRVLLNK